MVLILRALALPGRAQNQKQEENFRGFLFISGRPLGIDPVAIGDKCQSVAVSRAGLFGQWAAL